MRPRWRSRGRRRPAPHSLLPQRSEGRRESGFLVSRGMGGLGSPRDLSRGVVAQGKKVAMRRCGIGGRGEAVFGQIRPLKRPFGAVVGWRENGDHGDFPQPSSCQARDVTKVMAPFRAGSDASSSLSPPPPENAPSRRACLVETGINRAGPTASAPIAPSAPSPTIRVSLLPLPPFTDEAGIFFDALVRQRSFGKTFRPVRGSGWIGRWPPFPRPA